MAAWDDLTKILENCTACPLHESRTRVVIGTGNPAARLMLIGEGPGAQEDAEGIPFVGAAGRLLNDMLDAVDIPRADVYIANIVKCRPPKNRAPKDEEAAACMAYLAQQIALVNPDIILLLGATALKYYLSPELRITKNRGTWYQKDGRDILATFHPAALLRDPAKKPLSFEDMVAVRLRLREVLEARA